jgi:hypothetical protein
VEIGKHLCKRGQVELLAADPAALWTRPWPSRPISVRGCRPSHARRSRHCVRSAMRKGRGPEGGRRRGCTGGGW